MAITWTKHPVLDEVIPTKDEMVKMGPDKVLELWKNGKKPSVWKRKIRTGMATKSQGCGRWLTRNLRRMANCLSLVLTVQAKVNIVRSVFARLWWKIRTQQSGAFQKRAQTSVSTQMPLIWKYLPPEVKKMGRTAVGYVSYSLKLGFSQAKFTLNNGSVCLFKHYSQSVDTIEGAELGCPHKVKPGTFNIAFWADELVTMPILESLRFRNITRADPETAIPARGLISFTAVKGWNQTVKHFMTGAKILEERKAELLPGEKVPVRMQPIRKGSSVSAFSLR